MADGKMEGMFLIGQNSAVGAPNSRFQRKSMAKLKWFVIRDMVETEPARFWRDSAEIERGELKTEEIETEVFFFPAAGHAEKEGAFTNTQRLLQWREKAVDPPGDSRSDAWFIHQLALRLIAKARASNDPMDEPLRALDWWYPEDELGEPKMEAVLAEINGWKTHRTAIYTWHDGILFGGVDRQGNAHHGPQVADYNELKADGSTACGCWIYSGVFNRDGVNKANARKSKDYLGHGWGFSWPSDRRIIYNRASAKPNGEPWSERKKLVWWESEKWTGIDVPDFKANKPPDYRPRGDRNGLDGQRGDAPFILHEDGLGWMYVPKGLQDGPFPTHYEPLESPVRNPLYSRDTNPVVQLVHAKRKPFRAARRSAVSVSFSPLIGLTEHHTGGGMSRFLSHLSELQPEMFVEISPELAAELKINNSDYVCIVSLRGAIEARALVSRRIRPMKLNGKTVHQVAVPFHFGAAGPLRGNAANNLVAISGEPNVTIMESQGASLQHHPWSFAAWTSILSLGSNATRRKLASPSKSTSGTTAPPAVRPSGGKFSRSSRRKEGNGLRGMIGEGTQSTNQRRHTLCAAKMLKLGSSLIRLLHRLQSLRSRVQRMEPSA